MDNNNNIYYVVASPSSSSHRVVSLSLEKQRKPRENQAYCGCWDTVASGKRER
jgi:hypothetical protein